MQYYDLIFKDGRYHLNTIDEHQINKDEYIFIDMVRTISLKNFTSFLGDSNHNAVGFYNKTFNQHFYIMPPTLIDKMTDNITINFINRTTDIKAKITEFLLKAFDKGGSYYPICDNIYKFKMEDDNPSLPFLKTIILDVNKHLVWLNGIFNDTDIQIYDNYITYKFKGDNFKLHLVNGKYYINDQVITGSFKDINIDCSSYEIKLILIILLRLIVSSDNDPVLN